MTNDTQAPELIWAIRTGIEGAVELGAWADTVRYHGGEEYIRADLAAAQTAAAWLAGRDALTARASDLPISEIAADEVIYAAKHLTPPADASAALDALIAERVREAVEAEREACAKVADELATKWWSECKRVFDHHTEGKSDGADDIANAIRARGSKEGRDA